MLPWLLNYPITCVHRPMQRLENDDKMKFVVVEKNMCILFVMAVQKLQVR